MTGEFVNLRWSRIGFVPEMPSAKMPSAEMPSAEMPSAEMPIVLIIRIRCYLMKKTIVEFIF